MDEYKVVCFDRYDTTVNPFNGALEKYLNDAAIDGWRLASYDWNSWRRIVLVRDKPED